MVTTNLILTLGYLASTPASPTTPHVDLLPDDVDLLAAANQLQKEMEGEPEVGGARGAEAGGDWTNKT